MRIDGFSAPPPPALDGGRTSARVCAGAVDEAEAVPQRRVVAVGQTAQQRLALFGGDRGRHRIVVERLGALKQHEARRVEAAQLVEIRQAEGAIRGHRLDGDARVAHLDHPQPAAALGVLAHLVGQDRLEAAPAAQVEAEARAGRRGDGGVERAPLDCARAWTALSRSACSGPM